MGKARLEAFSDGVIAIIITIMVLEMKVPRGAGLASLRPLIATAVGNDLKGKVSVVIYALAVPLSFVNRWIAMSLYVVVSVLWFIPDRRIEDVIEE